MKFLNFLIVILSLSVESVLSDGPCSAGECPAGRYCNVNGNCVSCFTLPDRASCFDDSEFPPEDSATCASVCFDISSDPCDGSTCSPSNCVEGVYSGKDEVDCCAVLCKRGPICERINDIKDEKKKRIQCQRRKSTCRFSLLDISVDGKLGVDGDCMTKSTSDPCNTFGGGCILLTTTFGSERMYFINDCLAEESRMCTKNGCDYRLTPNDEGTNLKSECVSKQDECTFYNKYGNTSNNCNNNKKCVYDPCSDMCSIDCKLLSKRQCYSKEHKYQCRFNKTKKRCRNQ